MKLRISIKMGLNQEPRKSPLLRHSQGTNNSQKHITERVYDQHHSYANHLLVQVIKDTLNLISLWNFELSKGTPHVKK